MKTVLQAWSIALAGGLASLPAMGQATDVTFFDGGYAELCSVAAHNLNDMGKIVITGSRVDIPPLEICTLAIREGGTTGGGSLAASYTNRGVIQFAAGAVDAAMADFDAALRLDDNMAQAHVNRGYILNGREQWAEGIAAFDRGIALGVSAAPATAPELAAVPGSVSEIARAHYNRGIAHEELGHAREAYLDYLRASELAPAWAQPQEELKRFTVTRR